MLKKFKDDLILSGYLDGAEAEDTSEEAEKVFLENPGLKEEALKLKNLKEDLKALGEEPVPRDLNALIMKRVVESEPRNWLYTFLFRPRLILLRTSIAMGATAAAALVILAALAFHALRSNKSVEIRHPVAHEIQPKAAEDKLQGSPDGYAPQTDTRNIKFSISLPEATRVSLVGDFNEWSEDGIELKDDDNDGMWTVEMQIKPGKYQYKFVVNGKEWMVDEHADAVVDDGFGSMNSVRLIM